MSVRRASVGTAEEQAAFARHAQVDGGPYRSCTDAELAETLFLEMPLDALCAEWSGRRFVAAEGPFRCLVGYTDDVTANGASSIESGRFCASLTRGFIQRLPRLARYVVGTGGAVSMIRDSAPRSTSVGDTGQDAVLGPLQRWPEPDGLIDGNGFVREEANLGERLALLLHVELLRLAWHHELYHVLLGHTGWLDHRRGHLRMVKLRRSRASTERVPLLTLRALEHHADHAAVGSLCWRTLEGLDPLRASLLPELGDTARLALLQVAAGLLAAFWTQQIRAAGERDHEHPTAQTRYLGLLGSIRQILHQNERAPLYEASARLAFDLFATLSARDSFFSPLASLASRRIFAAASAERALLIAEIERLRTELKPFAFADA